GAWGVRRGRLAARATASRPPPHGPRGRRGVAPGALRPGEEAGVQLFGRPELDGLELHCLLAVEEGGDLPGVLDALGLAVVVVIDLFLYQGWPDRQRPEMAPPLGRPAGF